MDERLIEVQHVVNSYARFAGIRSLHTDRQTDGELSNEVDIYVDHYIF